MLIRPEMMNAMGNPFIRCGTGANSRRSRMPLIMMRASVNPMPAETPWTTASRKLYPSDIVFSSATPRIAQFVVISGR